VKFELGEVQKYVDWINVMTYDYTGGWCPITSFNAPLVPPSTNPAAMIMQTARASNT